MIGDQFGTLFAGAATSFDADNDGQTQDIALNLSTFAEQFLIDAINSGQTLRFIACAGHGRRHGRRDVQRRRQPAPTRPPRRC